MRLRIGLLFICLFLWNALYANMVRDTLESASGDNVFITYEYRVSGNEIRLAFSAPSIHLGVTNAKKYRNSKQVSVVFFDKIGNSPKAKFSGLVPKMFHMSSGLSYDQSEDGFFLLGEEPVIKFVLNEGERTVSIPIYLAYHQKRGKYDIFSYCGDLSIPIQLSQPTAPATHSPLPERGLTERVTTKSPAADDDEVEGVLECIRNLKSGLMQVDSLPIPERLENDVKYLQDRQYKNFSREVKEKIKDALNLYYQKKEMLEEDSRNKEIARAEAKERLEREQMAQLQAEQAAREEKERKESRKKTIWMTIGGIFLAGAAFAGNQALQHFRNVRNQRSIMAMQQSLARQAEQEVRRQTVTPHQLKNKAVNAGKKAIKDVVGKSKTNKKNFTI